MGQPRHRIERLAAELLRLAVIRRAPVDVEHIANHLGVRVERADLGDECSGVLVKKGRTAVIGVHWLHPPSRQRFTIAHELGHFRLHKEGTYVDRGMSAFYRDSTSGSGTVKQEREANHFAAALLMPAGWVEKACRRHHVDLVDDGALRELADEFGVSSQAMSFRLANLRIGGLGPVPPK